MGSPACLRKLLKISLDHCLLGRKGIIELCKISRHGRGPATPLKRNFDFKLKTDNTYYIYMGGGTASFLPMPMERAGWQN